MDDELVPERILELSFAFLGSKTLLSAVDLGLFTALATGPGGARRNWRCSRRLSCRGPSFSPKLSMARPRPKPPSCT